MFLMNFYTFAQADFWMRRNTRKADEKLGHTINIQHSRIS